ncbi:hypothetical protein [Nocardia sp. NPDC004750]
MRRGDVRKDLVEQMRQLALPQGDVRNCPHLIGTDALRRGVSVSGAHRSGPLAAQG